MRVFRSLDSFRSDAKLSTWIGRIAYNRCVDYMARPKDDYLEEFIAAGHEPPADNMFSPFEMAERAELGRLLRHEIGRLPAHYATIVTLFHLDEMTYTEIGDIMDLPEGTVKSYLFRARRMLRERLTSGYTKEAWWP